MSKTWKQRWKNPEVLYDLYICKDEKVYELVLVYVGYTRQKTCHSSPMFWYTQKNIGYTFSCNTVRLEKDVIFFLVRLLVWKWTYVILTHSKMTTFLSATNSKRKKDFVKISFSRPLFLPFQFPYHNLWTHGETQKFSSVPITWSRMRKKIGLSCSEISSLGCIQKTR